MLARMCAKIACSCTWYLYLVLVLVLGIYFERLLPSLHSNRIHGEQPSRAAVFKNHNMNSVLFVAEAVSQCDCTCAWKNVQDVCLEQKYYSTTMYNKLYVHQLPCAADPSPDRELKEARPHLPVEPPQTSLLLGNASCGAFKNSTQPSRALH